MKALLTAALTLAMTSQACAQTVGFRNPISDPQPSAPISYAAMIGAQTYDAVNSAHAFAHGDRELDPVYKPFSHGGAGTMLIGFAAADAAVLMAAKAFHVRRDAVARWMASQSVAGVLYTNDSRF